MYLYPVLRSTTGENTIPRVGDELIEPGLPPLHKRVFVGQVGIYGENVIDPAKGQPARLVRLDSIPNWQRLIVGERGPEDVFTQAQVQKRAWQVVTEGWVNRPLWPNCEHICSYIRVGRAESPQLLFWSGVAAVATVGALIVAARSRRLG